MKSTTRGGLVDPAFVRELSEDVARRLAEDSPLLLAFQGDKLSRTIISPEEEQATQELQAETHYLLNGRAREELDELRRKGVIPPDPPVPGEVIRTPRPRSPLRRWMKSIMEHPGRILPR